MSGSRSEILYERVQGGDRPALSALVERHLDGLAAFVRMHAGEKLRGREGISDLVQIVVLEAVEEYPAFRWHGEAAFKGWLYRKALLRVQDQARFHGRARRDPGREERLDARGPGDEGERAPADALLARAYRALSTPSQNVERREERERIEAAMHELPEIYRDVLSLSCLCGMTAPEIAEELGIEVETAKKRKTRGLVKLAALLGKEE